MKRKDIVTIEVVKDGVKITNENDPSDVGDFLIN